MYIAVDFDGTVVSHMYPEMGDDNPLAEEILKQIVDNGHELILYTMRSEQQLDDAIKWFQDRNIPLWDINNNKTQKFWTKSPKIYANLYIDDAALGIPLIYDEKSSRDKVDWSKVKELLIKKNIL